MAFFIFLIFLGVLVHLNSRINKIEKLLVEYKKDTGGVMEFKKPERPEIKPEVTEELVSPQPVIKQPESILNEQPVKKPEESSSSDLEFKLGSRIATGIGALAVIIGIGFFLRYAFENNLINETTRIILGLSAGLAFLVLGEFAVKRFPAYGQVVSGAGLGILYLSLYAAFNVYEIMSQPIAFFGMIIVTAIGTFLAIRHNAAPLACFAQIGGFITPLLLSSGSDNPHTLFIYLAILNIGILAIARWKLWRFLNLTGFVGTAIIYLGWFAKYYTASQAAVAEFYATLFFVIFLAVSIVRYFSQQSDLDDKDSAFLILNPVLYFAISYQIINSMAHDALGMFTVLLAAIYLILAFSLKKNGQEFSLFQQFLMGIGFIFTTIAIPIQLHKAWITVGWAAEALVLAFLGLQINLKGPKMVGLIALAASIFHLISIDSSIAADAQSWFNLRFYLYLVILFSLAGIYFLYNNAKSRLIDNEFSVISSALLFCIYALSFWALSLEINDFHAEFWLPVCWSVLAVLGAFFAFSFKNKLLRFSAYVTLIVIFFRLLIEENKILSYQGYSPVFNARFLAFIVGVAAFAAIFWLVKKNKESLPEDELKIINPALFLGMNGLLLWLLSSEIIDYFKAKLYQLASLERHTQLKHFENLRNTGLSVGWTLYAITILIIGILKKSVHSRFLAIFLFGIIIFKVFLFDTANLSSFYRFVSFITLGLILLLTGFLYYRYRNRISQFVKGQGSGQTS
jgi:uncharacterized membrane protein